MNLSRNVSEINGDFSRKSQNFPPVYFAPRLKGFVPIGFGTGAQGVKKTRIMGYRAEKEVRRYLQPPGYNTTWWTDRQTDGHRATAKTALTHSVAR